MLLSRAIVAMVALGEVYSISHETIRATLANLPPDTLRNGSELAAEYGHPAHTHELTTEDKYIITLFNIPGDKKRPVLVIHGVFDTSDGFILKGNRSLPILLVEQGYDVWLMNSRGNRYSRKHVTLNPDTDKEYWEYDLHDMANYDLASTIDYVLEATGQKQLSIVGFSQGTTLTFILMSSQPSYNAKVKVFVALAPIVFLSNARPLLSVIIQFSQFLDWVVPKNLVEFVGYYSLTKAILNLICTQVVIGYELCYYAGFNSLAGNDPIGIKRDFFPTIVGHFPAGASRMSLLHFSQIGLRKTFARYDYGAENLKKYYSFTPPEYDLSKVSVPVVLVSGKGDSVSTLNDVDNLKGKLPKTEHFIASRKEFNHLDHLWAFDAYEQTYVYVLEKLKKYN